MPPLALTEPDCGAMSPVRSRTRVVLPAPFGPIRAATTPSPTRNETSSSKTRPSGSTWLTCAASMWPIGPPRSLTVFRVPGAMADNNYMDAHGFNENSGLRASDADRDAAAAVVNNALAEGRLTADEHSERLDAIYSAKSQSELVPLLADLPGQRAAVPATASSAAPPGRAPGTPSPSWRW